ncbi:MAG: family efflux transporter [Ilumatobacteraceae bacterium]|nr:family efflux transporter [Ilumatobacteraceae bacterium]
MQGLDALDRRIIAIALPALGSLLVEPIYVLTDTAVVGHLGTVPLGGLAIASTVLNTLVLMFNFLSYGTTVRVAVRRGRGDREGAAADALQALWLALGIGITVALVIGLGAHALLGVLGDHPAVIHQGVTYLRISAIGVPFQFITLAAIGYLYGLPDTTRPFIVAASANAVNLVLELVLVFGFDRGIGGSAWGTVIAQIAGAAAMLVIVVPRLRADGLHRLIVVPKVMWEVVKVGAHLVQRTGFLLLALAVATATASKVGTAELAGHQIAAQMFLFLAIGVDMFKVSGQSLVGNALGAGNRDEARDLVEHLLRWAWRAGIALTGLVVLLVPVLPHLFSKDADVIHAAQIAMLVLAAMQVPAAITFVLDGVLMGANDFRDLRWQTTMAFVASLPIFGVVYLHPSIGIVGVWIALFVWVSVRAARNHHRVQGTAWMAGADHV